MPVPSAKKPFPLPFRYQRHVLGTATTCIGRGTKVFDGDNRSLNHGFIMYGESSMYSGLEFRYLSKPPFQHNVKHYGRRKEGTKEEGHYPQSADEGAEELSESRGSCHRYGKKS